MSSLKFKRVAVLMLTGAAFAMMGSDGDGDRREGSSHEGERGRRKGLSHEAERELRDAGVDKYLGEFTPAQSIEIEGGWVKHTYDINDGDGPICIAGTPYSVFTRRGRSSKKLLIFEQGGGACWQDFYNCNILSEDQEPPGPEQGIFDRSNRDNPFRRYSIVYMPYCDGSVFTGDNDVVDPNFPFGPVRYHRGLRNQSAAMDLAKATFPKARRITVAGSSAGGVGAAGFAPFLTRMNFGNRVKLTVFNDAGPVTVNPDALGAIDARAADWDFGKFYPASCTECSDVGDATEVIKWRLDNDSRIREAIYETDSDFTNRFFLGLLGNQPRFRELVVDGHGVINDEFPDRYKRFIVAGDGSHTALQVPLFYTQDADGVLLSDWTYSFLKNKDSWIDIVEPPLLP
ncbi:MAG TPA: hypothetical protein EYQ46_14505 [Myxococcales bacterium]|nr:hypothetical protein [Myxococcales bacterium]